MSLNVNVVSNLFESLASYQWQCAYATESFVCPSSPFYDLQAQSPSVDQFVITILLTLMIYVFIVNLSTMM